LHDIVARFELGGMDEQIQHRAEQKADEGDVPGRCPISSSVRLDRGWPAQAFQRGL
jgi:hypothetical protein